MTMKKGPSPALVATSLISSGVLVATSDAVALAIPSLFVSTVGAVGSIGSSILGSLGALSIPFFPSLAPASTWGLDLGAGLVRGLQDALTGGDLLTELLSVLGSGGTTTATTTIVAAPTVAPCPFC